MLFEEDIKKSLDVLRSGGVILYPTDTIWGLGCDPTYPSAIDKIFSIKSRPEKLSLIILVNGIQMLERYVKEVPETAYKLIEVSEKPLTIIYPHGINLAPQVCAEDGSVGIRICSDLFCSELISRLRKPLASTSANMSGKSSPSNFGEIDKTIIKTVDYVVGYRQNDSQKHDPSPVIKIENNGVFKILRI